MKIHYNIADIGGGRFRRSYPILQLQLRLSSHYSYLLTVEKTGTINHLLQDSPAHAYLWGAGGMIPEKLEMVMIQEQFRLKPHTLRLLQLANRHLNQELGKKLYRTFRFLPTRVRSEREAKKQQLQAISEWQPSLKVGVR